MLQLYLNKIIYTAANYCHLLVSVRSLGQNIQFLLILNDLEEELVIINYDRKMKRIFSKINSDFSYQNILFYFFFFRSMKIVSKYFQ